MIRIIHSSCPYCESKDFVKFCYRYNENGIVARFRCKNCKKTFIDRRDEFKKMKFDEEKISKAVWLYLSGMSSRQIKKKLKINATHKTIIKWSKRYIQNPEYQINASHRSEIRQKIAIGLKNYYKARKK